MLVLISRYTCLCNTFIANNLALTPKNNMVVTIMLKSGFSVMIQKPMSNLTFYLLYAVYLLIIT